MVFQDNLHPRSMRMWAGTVGSSQINSLPAVLYETRWHEY